MRLRWRTWAAAALLAGAAPGAWGCTGATGPTGDGIVLRTLRLAGYEKVAAWSDGRAAFVRLVMPSAASPADAELGWQSGFAALAVARPGASRYTVQLSGHDESPLLEVTAKGRAVRHAVGADDAEELREAAVFEFVTDEGGAVGPPDGSEAVTGTPDTDPAGLSLDAANRAAGLLGASGPVGEGARIATLWAAAYGAVPGRAAPADVIEDAVARIGLAATSGGAGREIVGAQALSALAANVAAGPDRSLAAGELKARAAVAEAVASPRPYGSVLSATATVARAVRDTGVPSAVPAAAAAVDSMERAEDLDVRAYASAAPLPTEVMVRHAVSAGGAPGALPLPDGTVLTPDTWLAYRDDGGGVFWLPDEGSGYALTDGSLMGWGYRSRRAFLVDAAEPGRVLAVYPVN